MLATAAEDNNTSREEARMGQNTLVEREVGDGRRTIVTARHDRVSWAKPSQRRRGEDTIDEDGTQ
jgi:hypothetical protein